MFITSGVIWTPYDQLNNIHSFHAEAVVSIISRCGLSIDAGHENQPNKHKLALYKPSIHLNSSLKQLYINSKMEPFSYKDGCGVVTSISIMHK